MIDEECLNYIEDAREYKKKKKLPYSYQWGTWDILRDVDRLMKNHPGWEKCDSFLASWKNVYSSTNV
jgi:hypothetical protein